MASHAKADGIILVREPDAGDLHVRFDEREVETDHGRTTKAPPDERAEKHMWVLEPPRHISTLPKAVLSLHRTR